MSIDDLMAMMVDWYGTHARRPHGELQRHAKFEAIRTAIEAALAAEYERGRTEREQDAEPVAWCSESTLQLLAETGFCHAELTKHARSRKSPLYASPPKRKPLTEERARGILREADWPESMLSGFVFSKLIALIRQTERAHGISDE